MSKISIINLLSMIGELNDSEGKSSTRERFLNNYLYKQVNIIDTQNDIVEIVKFINNTNTHNILYVRAYSDLINRLAQIVGFNVEYCEYNNKSGFSGIWNTGENYINIKSMIPKISNKIDADSHETLYIFDEDYSLGVKYMTIEKLISLFTLANSVNLPVGVLWGILTPINNIDKKIDSIMELILLGFKKKIDKHVDLQNIRKEWADGELNDFLFTKVKEPTYYFVTSLIDNKLTGKELVKKINEQLQKKDFEELKSPMALGALMGTMTKHYSGIKEPLVVREGKYYKLSDKYNDTIKRLCCP